MADRRSAYHAGRSVSESAHELIVQLPLHFSHAEGRRSLNFSELAYALDAVGKSVIKEVRTVYLNMTKHNHIFFLMGGWGL